MGESKKKFDSSYIHAIIGVGICMIFWFLPPLDPITPVGMRCLGTFFSMVYMWSTIGTLWPSIFGLFMLGISGVAGDGTAGVKAVWLNAIGNDTVVLVLLGMVLFGAVDTCGATSYVAKFLLTRKIYAGKPYIFISVWFFTCAIVSAFVSPIIGLIMLWPIAMSIMKILGITNEDKVWKFFFVGMFLVMTLCQPFIPFKGAPLIPISAFVKYTANIGMPMEVPYAQYMLVDAIMTLLAMVVFVLGMKILRVDVSKFKEISPEHIEKQMPLPPINFQQKYFLCLIPIFVAGVLIPSFTPKGLTPVTDFLAMVSSLGVAAMLVIASLVIKWEGKPLLDFQYVAYKQMNWGIFFMIAAAVYAAGTLSNSATGVTPWIIQTLNPLLGGQPEMVFVALMFTVALVITNFANNAAMATVLMPVVVSFSNQIGISPIPVAMGVILMVFVAMLTPAASPHGGMMWGRRDIYTPKDIISIGLPMCLGVLVLYIFIGYPLIKVLCGL